MWIRTKLLILFVLSQTVIAQEFSLSLDTGIGIRWATQLERSYQLQSSTDLGQTWVDLGNVVRGDGTLQSYVDTTISDGELYRVIETFLTSESVIGNGSFEEGAGASANSWNLTGNTIERSNTEANLGEYSIYSNIENVGNTPEVRLMAHTVSLAEGQIVAGESYDFSFWVNEVRNGVSYVQQYRLEWLNSENDVISGAENRSFDTETGIWTEVSESLEAPLGAVGARINFRFATGAVENDIGEVFIDDVSLALQREGNYSGGH